MPAKNLSPRGVRIPLPPDHWWPGRAREAAEKRADKLGIRRPGTRSLVDALAEEGVNVDEDTVSRCLAGKIVTWEVAIPLSKILGIKEPASTTEDPDENLDDLRKLRKVLERLRTEDER